MYDDDDDDGNDVPNTDTVLKVSQSFISVGNLERDKSSKLQCWNSVNIINGISDI